MEELFKYGWDIVLFFRDTGYFINDNKELLIGLLITAGVSALFKFSLSKINLITSKQDLINRINTDKLIKLEKRLMDNDKRFDSIIKMLEITTEYNLLNTTIPPEIKKEYELFLNIFKKAPIVETMQSNSIMETILAVDEDENKKSKSKKQVKQSDW